MKRNAKCLLMLLVLLGSHQSVFSQDSHILTKEQTIYVPAYSHIYSGNQGRPFRLTITLSIRNIDPNKSMRVHSVGYYESQGKLIKSYLESPITIKPLESLLYIIPEKDSSGGSGANFIVKWQSDQMMNSPLVEAIMIGTQNQQGISFVSRGKALVK